MKRKKSCELLNVWKTSLTKIKSFEILRLNTDAQKLKKKKKELFYQYTSSYMERLGVFMFSEFFQSLWRIDIKDFTLNFHEIECFEGILWKLFYAGSININLTTASPG